MTKDDKKEQKSLANELGIDEGHFNEIAKNIIEKVATGEVVDRLEIIKMAKEFTEAERDLLVALGLEAMISSMFSVQFACPPGGCSK